MDPYLQLLVLQHHPFAEDPALARRRERELRLQAVLRERRAQRRRERLRSIRTTAAAAVRRRPASEPAGTAVRRQLGEVGTEAQIAAGLVLIEPGQYGTGLFHILEGTVHVEAPEGVRELGPGTIVGERALLSRDGRRTARVRALTRLRVLVVDRAAVDRLCADDPAFRHRLAAAAT